MVVPRYFPTVQELMREINFTLPKVCKYMEHCNLASTGPVNWRKAMSHVFGRNKNCTRSIPEEVWLSLCRKHYQRARYRNNVEYSKRLCHLIQLQMLRIEAWSNDNRRQGVPENGILRDWSVVLRRRAQKRDEEENGKKRKRSADEEEDDDDDEDGPLPVSNTAGEVPRWLREMCGHGYQTREALGIVHRVADQIDQNILGQFPDVEILPNITGENARPRPKSRASKAKTPANSRRTRSVSSAPRAANARPSQPARPAAQPNGFLDTASNATRDVTSGRPSRRRRLDHPASEDGGAEGRGLVHPLNHPSLSIRPSHRFLDDRSPATQYGYANPGPLPAPRPSTYLADHRGGYDDFRARGSHQRGYSDGGGLNWTTATFGSGPVPGYGDPSNAYSAYYPPAGAYNPGSSYGRDYGRDYGRYDNGYAPAPAPNPQPTFQTYYDGYGPRQQPQTYHQPAYYPSAPAGPPPAGAARHMRHESTPAGAQRLMGQPAGPNTMAGSTATPQMSHAAPAAYDRFDGLYGGAQAGRHQSYDEMPAPMMPATFGPAGPARGGGEENMARDEETEFHAPGDGSLPNPGPGAGEPHGGYPPRR